MGPLLLDGIGEDPYAIGRSVAVPAYSGAVYIPGSSVIRGGIPGGVPRSLSAADQDRLPSVAAARAWLRAGPAPGAGTRFADLGERALLDLRLALRPNGALLAGPSTIWAYVWPRDAAWAAAALAGAGHPREALRALRFLARVQLPDGMWNARTLPDGGGRVPDARPAQLDALGWVPWAIWFVQRVARESSPDGRTAAQNAMRVLWPVAARAADAALRLIGPDGLPKASTDYWETHPPIQALGTSAAVEAGLRATADLAHDLGYTGRADTYRSASAHLRAAMDTGYGPGGYRRAPDAASPVDAAVAWLGPPLAEPTRGARAAIIRARRALTLATGGISPGMPWFGTQGESWTPETACFALEAASSGDRETAIRLLSWLDAHRTGPGALPERIDAEGRPAAIAPLAWSNAAVVLALRALESPLPVPGAPA